MDWDFDIYDPDMPVWREDRDDEESNKPVNPDSWADHNDNFETPY